MLAAAQARLHDKQQYLQEKFWRYRNGDDTYGKDREQIRDEYDRNPFNPRPRRSHELAIRARQVPRVDYRRQSRDTKRILNAPWADLNRVPLAPPGGNPPGFNIGMFRRFTAEAEVQRVAAFMTAARREFTFVKVLGAGGNGIVVLWRWTPANNTARAQGYDVAMKLSLVTVDDEDDDDDGRVYTEIIDDEKEITQNFARAPHMAQVFYFRDQIRDPPAGLGLRPRPGLQQQITTARNLDSAPGILPMEFARIGDLRNSLQRLAGEDNHLPPEAIWRIFDCLVKACIAMEYPPYLRFPTSRDGGPLPEQMPPHPPPPPPPPGANPPSPPSPPPPGTHPPRQPGYMGHVHFDLDPRNIFAIGYDRPGTISTPLNPSHTQVPRFQLGDFGSTKEARELWARCYLPSRSARDIAERRLRAWQQREIAKNGWFLPEQFSVEWDAFAGGPDEGPSNQPPALRTRWHRTLQPSGPGRYSYFSNIWHVGLTMFCTLLLQEPDFPPVAGRMYSEEPPQYDPVPARHQRWTYGYRLIEDSAEGREYRARFTPLLCETIAKCLMAKQSHRPNLVQLQDIITAALGDARQRLPLRVRRFFGSDAPPPVPWFTAHVDINLQNLDPFDPYPQRDFGHFEVEEPEPPEGRRVRRRRRDPGDRAFRN